MDKFEMKEYVKRELALELFRRQLDELKESPKETDKRDYHTVLFTPAYFIDEFNVVYERLSEAFESLDI